MLAGALPGSAGMWGAGGFGTVGLWDCGTRGARCKIRDARCEMRVFPGDRYSCYNKLSSCGVSSWVGEGGVEGATVLG